MTQALNDREMAGMQRICVNKREQQRPLVDVALGVEGDP
jgi:hypothetical protein